jgi:hypothetical protein
MTSQEIIVRGFQDNNKNLLMRDEVTRGTGMSITNTFPQFLTIKYSNHLLWEELWESFRLIANGPISLTMYSYVICQGRIQKSCVSGVWTVLDIITINTTFIHTHIYETY